MDTEARGVVKNNVPVIVILLRQLPIYDPPRFEIVREDTGEVLASGMKWIMTDASAECWLNGFHQGYDKGYEDGLLAGVTGGTDSPTNPMAKPNGSPGDSNPHPIEDYP